MLYLSGLLRGMGKMGYLFWKWPRQKLPPVHEIEATFMKACNAGADPSDVMNSLAKQYGRSPQELFDILKAYSTPMPRKIWKDKVKMSSLNILIGSIISAIGVLLVAHAYSPAYNAFGYREAYFTPISLTTGIIGSVLGIIMLVKTITR
jgi:hypothetical protein